LAYNQIEIREYAAKLGKGERTIRRWVAQGCNLRDSKSVREWVIRNQIRETPIERARKRRRDQAQKAGREDILKPQAVLEPAGNGEPVEPGRRGAAAALERLEREEEEAHRRLRTALAGGNPMVIDSAESFWLKCSETLRRLDLAVETARREAETQVPLRVAQGAVTASSEWIRIAFMQFLSSEARALMGIHDVGEWKAYAIERFKGVMHFTVKNAEKTNSAIPDWAVMRIKAAWNVDKADSGAFDDPRVS
jgi:hypothetical protein